MSNSVEWVPCNKDGTHWQLASEYLFVGSVSILYGKPHGMAGGAYLPFKDWDTAVAYVEGSIYDRRTYRASQSKPLRLPS